MGSVITAPAAAAATKRLLLVAAAVVPRDGVVERKKQRRPFLGLVFFRRETHDRSPICSFWGGRSGGRAGTRIFGQTRVDRSP